MALSTLTRLNKNSKLIFSEYCVYFVRYYSAESPKPAKISWSPPSTEVGYYSAERDYSRDKHFTKPQKKGDTYMRFIFT